MQGNLGFFSRFARFALLLLVFPAGVGAQVAPSGEAKGGPAVSKASKPRAEEGGGSQVGTPERDAGATDATGGPADAEAQSNRQFLDRELLRVRQQLENEALNRMKYGGTDPILDRLIRDLVPFAVFLIITSVLLWSIRIALDNRRWYRMVKVQTEMHTKLVDKLASNQEIMTYMESDAGKRFLESPRFDIQPKQSASFPFGRILWSAQAGLIAATVGVGLLFLRSRVPYNGATPLLIFGTIALTVGLGFLLSAAASYALSRHFGLLEKAVRDTEPSIPSGEINRS
jgi:hypothetical protein